MRDPTDHAIVVRGVRKSYQGPNAREVEALRDMTFNVRAGEFITLFGPNGCGKSTLLRILAGLETRDAGEVSIQGDSPGSVDVGFVFQNFSESLFPWRTALENIALGLEARSTSRRDSRERAAAFCSDLGISLPLDAFPYAMSGGQQQLTAVARALVSQPRLLLLDEPFSALDHRANALMEDFLLRAWRKFSLTVICVSHDIDQAIYLANRLLLLSHAPSAVNAEFAVDLPDNRRQVLKTSAGFLELRARVLQAFQREILI